jgi:hypothetical protein
MPFAFSLGAEKKGHRLLAFGPARRTGQRSVGRGRDAVADPSLMLKFDRYE